VHDIAFNPIFAAQVLGTSLLDCFYMFRTRLLLQFNRTSFPWIIVPVLFFLTVVLVESICILHINGSIFYTQDDPYIHLALSEKIAEFHYGINIGEPSAPSSSILWPFLLAAFARFTWHPLVPLAVNIAAQATTMAMLYRTMDLSFGSTQPVLSAVASILIAWCSGQIAPVFTGLEHNLHTSLTVASILGLIILNQQHRLPRWFLFVLVIAPLVRYEAAALSLMSIVMIWMRGHRRSATIVLILCVLLLGSFSAFLKTEGLPLLPGSVLVKLNENLDHGNSYALTLIKTLNLRLAQANERGVLLGLCLTILGWVLTGRGGWAYCGYILRVSPSFHFWCLGRALSGAFTLNCTDISYLHYSTADKFAVYSPWNYGRNASFAYRQHAVIDASCICIVKSTGRCT